MHACTCVHTRRTPMSAQYKCFTPCRKHRCHDCSTARCTMLLLSAVTSRRVCTMTLVAQQLRPGTRTSHLMQACMLATQRRKRTHTHTHACMQRPPLPHTHLNRIHVHYCISRLKHTHEHTRTRTEVSVRNMHSVTLCTHIAARLQHADVTDTTVGVCQQTTEVRRARTSVHKCIYTLVQGVVTSLCESDV